MDKKMDESTLKRIKEGKAIALIWDIEDVIQQAKDNDFKVPTEAEAIDILAAMQHGHDCNHGITWETINAHLEAKS